MDLVPTHLFRRLRGPEATASATSRATAPPEADSQNHTEEAPPPISPSLDPATVYQLLELQLLDIDDLSLALAGKPSTEDTTAEQASLQAIRMDFHRSLNNPRCTSTRDKATGTRTEHQPGPRETHQDRPRHPWQDAIDSVNRTNFMYGTRLAVPWLTRAVEEYRYQSLGDLIDTTPIECAACTDSDRYITMHRVPCGHHYCKPCLTRYVVLATNDESLYPPSCCTQKFPLQIGPLRAAVPNSVLIRYDIKAEEYTTENRTYCSFPTCGAFISPKVIDGESEVGFCETCGHGTCAFCKGRAHEGACPEDEEKNRMMALVKQEGWQRCENCRRMIERVDGCSEITCLCGHKFCYVCGRKWKTCGCERWDAMVAPHMPRMPLFDAQAAIQAATMEVQRIERYADALLADLNRGRRARGNDENRRPDGRMPFGQMRPA